MSEADRFIGMTVGELAVLADQEARAATDASRLYRVAREVEMEVQRAIVKHAPMHSGHEGYSVIFEELDELWDEVKRQKADPVALRKEAIQVAAMAIRFVLDVCDKQEAPRG